MRCRICRDRSPVGMVLGWRLDGYQIAVALVVAFVRDHPFRRCVSECRGDNGTSVWLERLASMWPFVWRAAWAKCRWVRRHAVFRLGMSFATCHRWAWGVFFSQMSFFDVSLITLWYCYIFRARKTSQHRYIWTPWIRVCRGCACRIWTIQSRFDGK